MESNSTILVTGCAGFIGYHVCRDLVNRNFNVIGIDNLNDYYDVKLKFDRLADLGVLLKDDNILHIRFQSAKYSNFEFIYADLNDAKLHEDLVKEYNIHYVIHLAAQAGVRYSIDNPQAYLEANLSGFLNVLELCRKISVKHLLFASSSSVYGLNTKIPFSESDHTDHPVSFYAATKKSNEVMAHAYASLYGIPITGLRFFTVYGPWGRPDMAYYSFAKNILEGNPIRIFNGGNMLRDFTYIDDVVESIHRLISQAPNPNSMWDSLHPDPSTSSAPYQIFNIGNSTPILLLTFINELENALEKRALKVLVKPQPGDVTATHALTDRLESLIGYKPSVSYQVGLHKFANWFKSYHY